MLRRFSRGLIAVLLAFAVVVPLAPTVNASSPELSGDNWLQVDQIPLSVSPAFSSLPSTTDFSFLRSHGLYSPSPIGYVFDTPYPLALSNPTSGSNFGEVFAYPLCNIPAGSDVKLSVSGGYRLGTSVGQLWVVPADASNLARVYYYLYAQYSDDSFAFISRSPAVQTDGYIGTSSVPMATTYNSGGHLFSFKADKTIKRLYVAVGATSGVVRESTFSNSLTVTSSAGSLTLHFNSISFVLQPKVFSFQNNQQNGLLNGILQTIKSFFSFVQTIPNLIINGFKDLLTFLFVPSDPNGFFAPLNDFFATKFGFVWQLGDYFLTFLGSFSNITPTSTFPFSGVDIDLGSFVHFVIPPSDVPILPPQIVGFVEAVKPITTCVFVGAWLHGVQNVLDWVIKKEGAYG